MNDLEISVGGQRCKFMQNLAVFSNTKYDRSQTAGLTVGLCNTELTLHYGHNAVGKGKGKGKAIPV